MKQVTIKGFTKDSRLITFYSTDEVANLFVEFGSLYHFPELDKHSLYVNSKYNFIDVVRFIDGYGLNT